MTPEAVSEELRAIVQRARAHEWAPDLFNRCQALLGYADVFNTLRRNLPPEEYEQFDLAYCNYIRPQNKELNEWLMEKRGKAGDEQCKKQPNIPEPWVEISQMLGFQSMTKAE